MDDYEIARRQILSNQRQDSQAIATYRIGNKDAVTGLYEVLGLDGSVIGYGQKIFNGDYNYGDLVRATKPYGSNIWALDRIDKAKLKKSESPTDTPATPTPTPTPPTPPNNPSPSNGFPTSPPTSDPNQPPTTYYNPPKSPSPAPPNCSPPPKGCRWQDKSVPCNGKIQDFDYVRLNTGTLILCCDPSVKPPKDGGCSPKRYSCKNGSCYAKADGSYATFAECQAALIPPPFTGGQCAGFSYSVSALVTFVYPGLGNDSYSSGGTYTGAIGGFTSFRNVPNTDPDYVAENIVYISANGVRRVFATSNGYAGSGGFCSEIRIENIVITPIGFVDNCGDPKPSCP